MPDDKQTTTIALTKVRLHPRRAEAVTIAEGAILTRWSLDDTPQRIANIQVDHAWFSDLAVSHDGAVFAVTTPENLIELRRWDDLKLVAEIVIPIEGESGLAAIDLSSDGRWIAVADTCERVHLVDRESGRLVATTDAGERTYCVRFDPSSGLLATACSFQGGGMVKINRIGDGELIPVIELNRSDTKTPPNAFRRHASPPGFQPGRQIIGPVRDLCHLPRCTTKRMAGRCCALRNCGVAAAMESISRCQDDRRQATPCWGVPRDGISDGSAVPERRDSSMWGDQRAHPFLPCFRRQTRSSSPGSSRRHRSYR